MHIDFFKIVGSIIGAKIVFWFFSPSEIWTIIFVLIFIMIGYGIQVVEWIEKEEFSVFGLDIYHTRKVYQQYRIFGIIPISEKESLRTEHSFFTDLDPLVSLPIAKTAISMLPFGTMLSKVGKN